MEAGIVASRADGGKSKAPSASAERLRQRREGRQTAILRAAGAEILSAGYSGASLDRIADAVFVSKATLYHYFPTKSDLYRAWLTMVHGAATERLEPLASSDLEPLARLRAMIVEEVMLLTTDFPDYARVFLRGMDWPDELRGVIHAHREAHEDMFRSVIVDGIESGAFSISDPSITRHCLQGILAYIPEWYQPNGRLSAQEVGDTIADLFLRVVGSAPGRKATKRRPRTVN